MKKLVPLALLLITCCNGLFSQNKFIIQNKKQVTKVNFKLINNLIVIPVKVNGVDLSFILDTGVSKPIIFNFLNASDSLNLKSSESIFMRGLGGGEVVEASKSQRNIFEIGEAISIEQDLFSVYDLGVDFGSRLGVPIHGIIGLDIFKDFVVEIKYASGYIKLTKPELYKYKSCRKCERLNLEFYNDKPYLNAHVSMGGNKIPVKLLIDSGGSDSLWLFEDDSLGIQSGTNYFKDFLGRGLSGSVFGKRGRIGALHLSSFVLKSVNVAYPDSTSIVHAKRVKVRNGSLAGNVLKRFNIILDYKKALITISKNKNFKEKFSYNRSGVELAHQGMRLIKEYEPSSYKVFGKNQSDGDNSATFHLSRQYKLLLKPAIAVVELREHSAAYNAGLKKGDIILSVNGKSTHQMELQSIMLDFYGNVGKQIRLKVERGQDILTFTFRLESLLD